MEEGLNGNQNNLPMATPPTIKIIIEEEEDSGAGKNTTEDVHNSVNDQPTRTMPSFLVGLHPGYFTITNSMSGQALLWKTLSQNIGPNSDVPWIAFHLLWWLAFSYLFLLTFLYSLRCILHFKILKQEFSNPVLLNYLFAPWISWMLLLQSAPLSVPYHLWWFLVIPVIFLDLKLYGQWFTTEKRFLSMFANPTTQMSITANMVAAWTASRMGWKESAVCIFSVGAVHYFVVFVTLYQRFSGAANFPALLRPVFLMFVAAPCAACLAWSSILGTFSISCKLLFFLSLFRFLFSGLQTGVVQEVDEEIQHRVVGLLVSSHASCIGVVGIWPEYSGRWLRFGSSGVDSLAFGYLGCGVFRVDGLHRPECSVSTARK